MYEFLIVFAYGAGLIVRAANKNAAWKKALELNIPDEDIHDVRFYKSV